jgi:hypothetical protein
LTRGPSPFGLPTLLGATNERARHLTFKLITLLRPESLGDLVVAEPRLVHGALLDGASSGGRDHDRHQHRQGELARLTRKLHERGELILNRHDRHCHQAKSQSKGLTLIAGGAV